MPLYEFKCECGKIFTKLITIEKRNDSVECKCGKQANRAITTSNLHGFDKLGRSKNE